MEILTVDVGQGHLTVIRDAAEAFVVDAKIPASGAKPAAYYQEFLSRHIGSRRLRGLIITQFSTEFAEALGAGVLLRQYKPQWLMFPRHFKPTAEVTNLFQLLGEFCPDIKQYPIKLENDSFRYYYPQGPLAEKLKFEIFSPHSLDPATPSTASLVVKVQADNLSYLVTGNTDNDRWAKISRIFGLALHSDVMTASRHGADHGINRQVLSLIRPHTVLISAGKDNPYGCPQDDALRLYRNYAKSIHCTIDGQSFRTYRDAGGQIATDIIE